jgi:hypothetical protein
LATSSAAVLLPSAGVERVRHLRVRRCETSEHADTAATLHANGRSDIQSTEQAAEALKPIAGEFAFILFSISIIGTGRRAGAGGLHRHAAGELFACPTGLEHPPQKARGFYCVIAAAIVLGIAVDLSPLDPIKALVWSAVVNGVTVVPVLVAIMIVASSSRQVGRFAATRTQRIFGWLTTLMMAIAAVAMFARPKRLRSLTALQPLLTTTEVTSPFSILPIQTSVDGACRRPVVRVPRNSALAAALHEVTCPSRKANSSRLSPARRA